VDVGLPGYPRAFPTPRDSQKSKPRYTFPPHSLNALQEMMLDKAREGEKATPLRIPDSLLKRSYVRTGLQVILMNADHPGHLRFPGR